MTAEEAIAIINGANVMVMNRDPDKFVAATNEAIIALYFVKQMENPKPLTIEELQLMNGEPVWIDDVKCWGVINTDDHGTWKDVPFVTFYSKCVEFTWNVEMRGLTCYRHKPKEE